MTDNATKALALTGRLRDLLRRWGRLGGLAAFDQFLFSGSNLAVNILLIRWISPSAYGAFAVAFSLYLFLAGLLCSLTLEPMMIFGANDYRKQLRAYLSRIGWLHGVVAFLLGLLALGIAVAGEGETGGIFQWAAVALPFMLMGWFVRRAFYTRSAVGHAVISNLIYASVLLGGLALFQAMGHLSSATIYGAFIGGSLGCLVYYSLASRFFDKQHCRTVLNGRELLARHWNYGRWMMAATLASSMSTLMYTPLLGLVASLEAAAAYKAIQTMTQPLIQMLASLSLLLLPLLSRRLRSAGRAEVRQWVRYGIAGYVLLALGYGMLMMMFRVTVVKTLYTNAFYAEYVWMIPYFVVVLVLVSACQFLGIVIRACEAPRVILAAKVAAGGGLLLGVGIVPVFKLKGVLICMVVSALLELCIMVIYFIRKRA